MIIIWVALHRVYNPAMFSDATTQAVLRDHAASTPRGAIDTLIGKHGVNTTGYVPHQYRLERVP